MNLVGVCLILSLVGGVTSTEIFPRLVNQKLSTVSTVVPQPSSPGHLEPTASIVWILIIVHNGLFGDTTAARIDVLKGVFFTDAVYPAKGGAVKYSISTYILDGPSAEAACKRGKGRLARISSQDKFNFISNWLDTISPYDKQQIHVAGVYKNNEWTYENTVARPYFSWHSGEPSSIQAKSYQESCLVMEKRNGTFKMNDLNCQNIWRRYLCEDLASS